MQSLDDTAAEVEHHAVVLGHQGRVLRLVPGREQLIQRLGCGRRAVVAQVGRLERGAAERRVEEVDVEGHEHRPLPHPLAYELASEYEIPTTFAEGIAAHFTRPGQAGDGMVHTVVWRVGSRDALEFWADRLSAEGHEVEVDSETGGVYITLDNPSAVRKAPRPASY